MHLGTRSSSSKARCIEPDPTIAANYTSSFVASIVRWSTTGVRSRNAEANFRHSATGLGVAATLRRLRLYVEADEMDGSLFLSPRELTRWARATSRYNFM